MRDGGPQAYRPFVQAYGPYLYRTVYAVLQSPHDAEDVTQEVLMQIYRSLPDCRLDGFKTWITRIAVNRAIDFKRKKARRPEQLMEDGESGWGADIKRREAVPPPQVLERSAEDMAISHDERSNIRALVEHLPANYREVVYAYYMEDKSYEQIAAETGLERKSVESRLYRARNWMKRHWRKEDFE
ncbi:sigma-70 family RNA polymerase sigma factor [Paenibacillus sp. J5C_2022]|uniref:RNA polymerase sigma factor n=1 Tax=Paenibacillus sp. J5C2022 TaxID=2977129 RepID=UPI0021D1E53B|nr:sigma-70 family RNA polymerase sigma factor [Paenibacillus sp. J5C2022]MCU6710719.1 sigma-70 family RNA polymerase sigma factor [Paenibacillus sp. J5C2022]